MAIVEEEGVSVTLATAERVESVTPLHADHASAAPVMQECRSARVLRIGCHLLALLFGLLDVNRLRSMHSCAVAELPLGVVAPAEVLAADRRAARVRTECADGGKRVRTLNLYGCGS